MPSFLIYDPETLFEAFLIKHDLKVLFSIDCHTTKESSHFLEELKNQYDATILLEKEHSDDALSLVQHVKNHPIIFFVTEHRTATSFEKLKEEMGVDYVLQTPLLLDEMTALLRALTATKIEPDIPIPPELVAKYRKGIFEKINRIEALTKACEKNRESLKDLRMEVHKIAGSAGSYGFVGASNACKEHELFLMEELKSKNPLEGVDKKNAAFLRKLRLHFQYIDLETKIQARAIQKEKLAKRNLENTLLLVSSDLALINTFQNLAKRFQVPLTVESDPRKVLEGELSFNPLSIIVEEYYPFTTIMGINLIDAFKKTSKPPIKFGIISNTEDVNQRIAWSESNINWILTKPITENNILQVFQQMESKSSFPDVRALIMDDDNDVGLVIKEILRSMGMEVLFLNDERHLLKTLEEFTPHLLLLDVNLPYFNGQKLLAMLRRDIRFQRLIIVIMTGFKEQMEENLAYQTNCDSVIYKPIDPKFLQARIANLLNRHMTIGLKTVIDPITGLYEKLFFLQKVANRLPHMGNKRGAFVLLGIDLWDQISQTLSTIEREQIIILLAISVKQYFGNESIYGYIEETFFAMLFEGLSGGEIEFKMDNFLLEMKKTLWLSGREELRFNLSIGILLFDSEGVEAAELLTKTAQALAAAQMRGGEQIEIRRLTESQTIPTETKRVVLVDDDVDLCEVISYMFRNQGIHVDVFHTGADAINFFAKMEEVNQNVLFILDRMLPDRDGLTLLRLMREKFPGKVKAIFLTSLSTERDVLEGLKMGAVDYVTKPFSVPVLLQKALALLNR